MRQWYSEDSAFYFSTYRTTLNEPAFLCTFIYLLAGAARKNGDKHLGVNNDTPPVWLLRVSHTDGLLRLLRGQRRALQLHPAAAAEPRAQRDAAGDPLHPGAAAPPAADRPYQTQRCAHVHVGLVQHDLHRRIFLLQDGFTEPGLPHGDGAGQPLPPWRRYGDEFYQHGYVPSPTFPSPCLTYNS